MTNYLAPENNRKYRPCSFDQNGFFIGNLESTRTICFESLRISIIDSRIFEDKKISWRVFNEANNVSDEGDEGRNQVSIAAFKKKQKTDYCEILSKINAISDGLVETCNKELGYSIDPKNSIPTILETTSKNSTPQLVHVDMGYDDYKYREQLLCLIALQDNTYFRIVRGSHAFATLLDLRNNKCNQESNTENPGNGFMIPTVVTLERGQFIVMHPKLFHSGWIADGHNIRLHFYFNLKQIKLSSNRKVQEQAETYIMETEIASLFNGEARSTQIKNLKASSMKKLKSAKVKKAMRFVKK